eukprot:350411-Chlamydomonas_euryale.AAC.3
MHARVCAGAWVCVCAELLPCAWVAYVARVRSGMQDGRGNGCVARVCSGMHGGGGSGRHDLSSGHVAWPCPSLRPTPSCKIHTGTAHSYLSKHAFHTHRGHAVRPAPPRPPASIPPSHDPSMTTGMCSRMRERPIRQCAQSALRRPARAPRHHSCEARQHSRELARTATDLEITAVGHLPPDALGHFPTLHEACSP